MGLEEPTQNNGDITCNLLTPSLSNSFSRSLNIGEKEYQRQFAQSLQGTRLLPRTTSVRLLILMLNTSNIYWVR